MGKDKKTNIVVIVQAKAALLCDAFSEQEHILVKL